MTSLHSSPSMRVMPREMRLMSERIFSLSSLPKGFFLTIGDIPMYSQKLGLGGFKLFEQRFESFKSAVPTRIAIASEAGNRLTLDACGEHAWFVLPTAIDLLGELAARFGSAELTVTGTMDVEELAVAARFGGRSGLSISVSGDVLKAVPAAVTGDVQKDDPLLWSLLESGAEIESDLWWRIYHLAKQALATDSVVSRRHAGPMIVNEDGTVIGRKDNDDETDVSFLSSSISERMKESARS
ncbi:Hypothetical protein RG1141_PA15100 (plasmid) [Neorhizobium galegae bv. officinalis bv. officinalis str. HAMBI 1141]|uniref:Uncharacterized protein n=1 Tax=Neorhizobium galegae bv. officinalis bv. officinalis str. HAMBI 1141 TaxID=1028801 RepID=A0A068TIS1_NEOGA|nr:hypothetical protein [Neorhizobium galegae]CDN58342.1 Hypothetical protein RG1141_PA15100 [Neorhizobium galegae bv. officinalis bv. officinalis str. HAMBI 1141]